MRDKILKFLSKNPKASSRAIYLEDILTQEDFVIYFYCKHFGSEDIELNEQTLKIALEEQKLYWINDKSRYSEKSDKLHKEYIQSKVKDYLNDDKDFADAFVKIVMERFKEIQEVDDITVEEYNSLIKADRKYIQKDLFQKIISDISPLVLGTQEHIVYNNVRYSSSNILELLSKMASDKVLSISNIDNYISKEDEHNLQLSNILGHATTADKVFSWNISGELRFLPDVVPGDVIGLIANRKAGKTRMTIGEMIFPALLNGKNVKIYSGEMEIEEIYALLVIKYLYSYNGIFLDFRMVKDIIIISEKLKYNKASDNEIETLNSYGEEYVQFVLSGLYFFKHTKEIGRLKLVRAGDSDALEEFIMENVYKNNINEIQNTLPENRYDLIVFDHVNIFKSRIGMRLEEFVQDIVRLSKNNIYPCATILINHMKTTDLENKINKETKLKDLEEIEFSSHGTSELQKSATLFMVMVELPELVRAGQIALKIEACRSFDIIGELKTNVFKLMANKGVCDFNLMGQTKLPYKMAKDK